MLKPAVIVLGLGVNGLVCARALARQGVRTYGVSFLPGDVGRVSKACSVLKLEGVSDGSQALCQWLLTFAGELGERPVVLPTSDASALMLARNRELLDPVCRIWDNTFDRLDGIVSKTRLYPAAQAASVPVPPGLISTNVDEVRQWIASEAGPYLVKPSYQGAGQGLDAKNLTFETGGDLLRFIRSCEGKIDSLIIQRILRGGDGWIFDCYGLADRDGRICALASHRRMRQSPADFGITCYGEIPASVSDSVRQQMQQMTERLLQAVGYHGIFGIEWLLERETNRIYLLDFNARPFYTIGHLADCGLNLPLLAYRELCGEDLPRLSALPELSHKYWVDFWPHLAHCLKKYRPGWTMLRHWLKDLLRARSFAIWDRSDLGPSWMQTRRFLGVAAEKLKSK